MTYQMLIVDDEVHAIEGVKADLDLNKLEIAGLFTAYNIRQAKDVFEKENIDILLCDIEMPQGSGLQLLSWVQEHRTGTATIFLTSHADFRYAKEALQLGSLDYLLKPVLVGDLEKAIRKAQSVIDRNGEISRNSMFHQLWLKHHALIIERFWLDLINHSIPSYPDGIRDRVESNQIPIAEGAIYLPILIAVQKWHKPLKRRDEKILEYALKNSAEEIIIQSHGNGIGFYLERGKLFVILVASGEAGLDERKVMDTCRRYIASCNRYFSCDLSCYLGAPVEVQDMADMVAKLRIRERNNVVFINQVYSHRDGGRTHSSIRLPALSSVSSLLKIGKKEAVIQEVRRFLDDFIQKQEMDANILHQFVQDFMQTLYSFLIQRGIQAHQLFGDEESRRISEAAGRSVTDMLAWIHYVVNRAMDQVEAVNASDSVVKFIREYIALNLDQNLSREKIAHQVFLNPDYLSRVFKKETGYSLSDYILLERIKLAKELLSQTKVPVSSIASSVGYTNFSHFSKIFRKYAGIGPTEYRNRFTI
ncbi:response regulator [Paenibacillus macerans]|uniref:response regulator n=1 Tax=Paenibacillus macerans TaxID=44252 RepID=UPI002040660E|nr:response regulator [Paenibacillus macerans]MCM3703991.1 response regulator [Paenibacillus macerans]